MVTFPLLYVRSLAGGCLKPLLLIIDFNQHKVNALYTLLINVSMKLQASHDLIIKDLLRLYFYETAF